MMIRNLSWLGIGLLGLASVAGAVPSGEVPLSPDYKDVKIFLQKLVADHPKTTQLFNLGLSDSGDVVLGVKIGDSNPSNVHNLIVSTHHGNEYGSTEVAKAFALSLAEQPIKGQTLYVIPVLNIKGFDHRDRYEPDTTGGSHDPNRDYPGPCGTEGPFKLKDTTALAQFIDRENIVASGTLHTFSPAVVYPWGISTQDLSTHYDDIFKTLVVAATVESHYASGNNTELIYPADGTFEDYAFWKHGVWSILFELGYSHNPTLEQVRELQKVNVPGMRRMFEQSPRTRAELHSFEGHCDVRMMGLDRHDE